MEGKNSIGLIEKLIKNDKARNILIIVGIAGIALIYLSSFIGDSGSKQSTQAPNTEAFATSEFEEKLEKKLAYVVSGITGEEKPIIMLTLENQSQYVYAADEKNKAEDIDNYGEGGIESTQNSNDNETSYIILKDESGAEHALKITEIQPEIKGVVIVSAYANNALTKEKITNSVKTALGISSSKVCVVGTN